MNDCELLALQTSTIFVLADNGWILRSNAPDRHAGPRLYLAGSNSGNVVRLRNDVGQDIAGAIERLAAREPMLDAPDSTPVHLDHYLRLLSQHGSMAICRPGLIWTFPETLRHVRPALLIISGTRSGDALLARYATEGIPGALVAAGFVDTSHFWEPWCVALDGQEIASIAFTPGLSPGAAETGVHTMPAFRRRGFGAAAVAGWAKHPQLVGRALFYSTDRENVSSQRVAARLGLRFIGARLWVD
jgi:hypothetical protein